MTCISSQTDGILLNALNRNFSLDEPLFLSILSFILRPKQFQINSVVIRHLTAVMIGILEYRTSFLWQKQMFA
jgi:hypothetical protein